MILVAFLVWCSAAQAVAQTNGAGTGMVPEQFSLKACVNSFSPEAIESTKAGSQYWFVRKEFLDGRTIKMSVVRPHAATHPPHVHAEDEFFFVLEGRAELFLNGDSMVVGSYTSFYCPPNTLHGIRNAGDRELRYLVIKKYAPEIRRDTSFTTGSAWRSIRGEFPDASPARVERAEDLVVERDLVYASRGGRDLHLDVVQPRGRAGRRLPVVILIHGGGWRSGDKSQAAPMAHALAAGGYAAIAVEYRLSGEARYPAAVHDLKSAIRWVRENAAVRGFDSSRVAALGTSAGGTLAALLGATGDDSAFDGPASAGGVSTRVQAVVDIDGVVDMTDPAESGKDTDSSRPSAGALWLGATYAVDPALWREASPLSHAGAGMPPVLFLNSSQERFHAGRDRMIEVLKSHGQYYEVHTIAGTPHPFWLFHPWFGPTCKISLEFLDRVLMAADE